MTIPKIISPHRTKRAAADAGAARFYTGRLCKHGHDCERYTVNGCCVDCLHPPMRKLPTPEGSNVATFTVGLTRGPDGKPRQMTHEYKRQIQIWLLANQARICQEVDAVMASTDAAPRMTATEKCCGTPLLEFLRLGWTHEQLLAQGYAVPV